MANLNELKQNRNKLLTDAQQILISKTLNAETRTAANKMIADADLLDEQIALEERIAKAHSEERNSGRPPRSQPGDQGVPADVEKQKMAFRDWMRTGHVSQENRAYLRQGETRDLLAGGGSGIPSTGTGGSVLVPVGFDPQFHVAQKSFGEIVGAVRQFQTDGGGPIRVALGDDTEQVVSLASEATAVSESDVNLSGFESFTDLLSTGLIRVSNELLQDAAFDVSQFIETSFAARYYRGLAKAIALGNGSNIQKMIPGGTVTGVTGTTTSVTYANLVDTFALLDPAFVNQASWCMNSTTKAGLMKLTDNYGHPLLQTDLTGQPFNALFGRPIVNSQLMPTFGPSNTPILFGDLKASYTLRTAGPLLIARTTERYFELYETGFCGWVRAGGYNTSQAASSSLVGFTNSAT